MPAHILHVEDDPNDAFLVRRALTQCLGGWTIQCVADGDQAVEYLSGIGDYADRNRYPLPDLVLLDLKLRSMHGFDLLAWARAHPQFRRLPIIVLSGSTNETDRVCAYELGASLYFLKTPHYKGLTEAILAVLAEHRSPRTGLPCPPLPPPLLRGPSESAFGTGKPCL